MSTLQETSAEQGRVVTGWGTAGGRRQPLALVRYQQVVVMCRHPSVTCSSLPAHSRSAMLYPAGHVKSNSAPSPFCKNGCAWRRWFMKPYKSVGGDPLQRQAVPAFILPKVILPKVAQQQKTGITHGCVRYQSPTVGGGSIRYEWYIRIEK